MAKRDYILHNFWWKITSLLLATIVWMVVRGTGAVPDATPRLERKFTQHSLSLLREATDKRPIRITPSEVEIVVAAPPIEAMRLVDADIQTFVDMNDVDDRTDTVRIRVYVPRGVLLRSIEPQEATVEILE
jgi:hypothetical protein